MPSLIFTTINLYVLIKLYEEIIFLQNFSKSFFCVENVISYYQPLIQPKLINKHYLWANFFIPDIDLPITNVEYGNYHYWEKLLGFKLPRIKTDIRKDKLLRNTMNPKLGLHILNSMLYSSGIKNSYFQTPLF
jgi:DNA (cytosine-5)-methyltransferase 1